MAVSSAFVVSPYLETSLANHHNPSSSPTTLGLIGIRAYPMNNRTMRGLIQRARCEPSSSDAANVSALKQLKNSAIDSRNLCLVFQGFSGPDCILRFVIGFRLDACVSY